MTDNRIERRVLTYIRRRADGKFMFPHAVRAHLADIMQYAPWAITPAGLHSMRQSLAAKDGRMKVPEADSCPVLI